MAIRCGFQGLVCAAILASAGVARASGPVVVLFAATEAVPEELLTDLRAYLDAPIVEASYAPVAPEALAQAVPDPWAEETAVCLADRGCLERLQGELGVAVVISIELQTGAVGGDYAAQVAAQQGAIRTSRVHIRPGTREQLAADLEAAVRSALRSIRKWASQEQLQRRTMMTPRQAPAYSLSAPSPPASATPAAAKTSPAAAEAQKIHSGYEPVAATARQWTYKLPQAERPLVGVEFGAWGGLQPGRHHRASLLVGERIKKSRLGRPAAGISVDFRLPIDGSYETNRFTYAFLAPISALALDLGFEKRWEGGTVVPLAGGGVWLTLLGLPVVDPDGAEQTARTLVLGGQVYCGAAFFPQERIGLHLRAGLRFSPKKANQFDAGDQTYYALDAHGATWDLNLTGPMAEAGVTFEL